MQGRNKKPSRHNPAAEFCVFFHHWPGLWCTNKSLKHFSKLDKYVEAAPNVFWMCWKQFRLVWWWCSFILPKRCRENMFHRTEPFFSPLLTSICFHYTVPFIYKIVLQSSNYFQAYRAAVSYSNILLYSISSTGNFSSDFNKTWTNKMYQLYFSWK